MGFWIILCYDISKRVRKIRLFSCLPWNLICSASVCSPLKGCKNCNAHALTCAHTQTLGPLVFKPMQSKQAESVLTLKQIGILFIMKTEYAIAVSGFVSGGAQLMLSKTLPVTAMERLALLLTALSQDCHWNLRSQGRITGKWTSGQSEHGWKPSEKQTGTKHYLWD